MMCVEFTAKDKLTKESTRVEMVDHGVVGPDTFYSTFIPDGREVIGSYFAGMSATDRMRADELALNQFGLSPNWDTIKNNECHAAHAKHEAA